MRLAAGADPAASFSRRQESGATAIRHRICALVTVFNISPAFIYEKSITHKVQST
jgi:ribosomal protein L32